MKKEKVKFGVYLPKEIYAELYRRQLPEHFSFLVACLLEEFFKRTDISISREEMPTRAEQREYIKRKVQELFSRSGVSMQERTKQVELSAEPSKPPMKEESQRPELPAEPLKSSVQEPSKEVYAVSKPKPVKEEPPPPSEKDNDIDILKSLENLW